MMTRKVVLTLVMAVNLATAQWNTEGVAVMDSSISYGDYFFPKMITDGRGGCYIIWNDYRNGTDYNIFVQRLDSSGREFFPHNGVPVELAPSYQQTNLCVEDGKGGLFITWADDRAVTDTYIYAQHMDSSGQMLWHTDGVKVADVPGLGGQVVNDGAGGIIVNYTAIYGVVLQRLDSTGARMWGDSGISQSNNGLFVNYWHSTTDGRGGVVVTWIQGTGIYAQRIRHSGSVAWQQHGVRLSTIDTTRSRTYIESDGDGGATIAWTTGSNVETRVQRVDSAGNLLWGNNGVHIGSNGMGIAVLISDQKGGVIVPAYPRLYRIRADGSFVWPGGISFADWEQARLVSDGASGVNIAYSVRYKNNQSGMYVQRIDSGGVVRWMSGGILLDSPDTTVSRQHPAAVSDGRGGIILAWDDMSFVRLMPLNIYAARLNSQGDIATKIGQEQQTSLPERSELLQNFPNPFNPETTINYTLASRCFVRLTVHDLLGRVVSSLVSGQQSAGRHEARFNAQGFSSGVYFYRLTDGVQTLTRKMLVIH